MNRVDTPRCATEEVQMVFGVFLMLMFVAALAGPEAPADSVDAEAAFDLLKKRLVGEWKGEIVHSSEPVEATFYLTGNDSAIVEHIRRPMNPAGSMSTVYHLADDDLQLTHYCSFMNQPRLRAASVAGDGSAVNFEFIDVSNLSRSGDRYTHRMRVAFPGTDRAEVTYTGLIEGTEAGDLTVALTRAE